VAENVPENRKGILSAIANLFYFRKKDENQPVRVHLPSESNFYYDSNLNKWVNKKAGTISENDETLAPPPIISNPTLASSDVALTSSDRKSSLSSPNNVLMPGAVPSTTNKGGKRRTARSKYVDVINPNTTTNSGVASFVPSFAPGDMKLPPSPPSISPNLQKPTDTGSPAEPRSTQRSASNTSQGSLRSKGRQGAPPIDM
jgi:hypothetical protein